MADDFDIEAYLEEQVDAKSSGVQKEAGKPGEGKLQSDAERGTKREPSPPYDDRRRDDRRRRSGERDRDSGRDRYRDRDYRDRSRDRSRDRDRDRRRGSRSRSPDRKPRRRDSRERDRDRDRDRDRRRDEEPKETKEPVVDPISEYERELEKELARKQKEIDDLTKDQRTVFVSQLTSKVTEGNLRNFFSQIGKVNNIIMIRDKHSGKHKGFAYVEMGDLDDIPNCLLFNNVVPDFQKFAILVKPSEAEKNFVARKDPVVIKDPKAGPDCRVYIGNIHISVTDAALKSILDQFGPTESIVLHRDDQGNSKGFAFARFIKPESAQLALQNLGGLELAGRPLKVGPVTDGMSNTGLKPQPMTSSMDSFGQSATANWKLDDDDGATGMQLNSQSRVMLMAKLGQAAGLTMPTPMMPPSMTMPPLAVNVPKAPQVVPPIAGSPSCYFVMKNMFSLMEETSVGWDVEIREDVTEECGKFGQVLKCYVEKRREGGMVYLQLGSVEGAVRAAQSLQGRFFAGRMVTVTYLDAAQFNSLIS